MSSKFSDRNPVNCIWMDAGVVGYKLCDRDLLCDQCPFDQSMRRPSQSAPQHETSPAHSGSGDDGPATDADRVAALIGAIAPGEFPEDRLYHSGHLWVRPLMESIVAIGIDHLGASMLGSLASVVLPSRQSRIIHRMPWCWLIHHEGAISLYSPVHGIIVESNNRLLDHPELLVQDPYGDGWLVHAQIDKSAAERPTLFSPPEYRTRTKRELVALQGRVMQTLKRTPTLGETLYDGGQPAETLAAMLGSRAFFNITATLFAP